MGTYDIVNLSKSTKELHEFLLRGNPKKNQTISQENNRVNSHEGQEKIFTSQPTIEPSIWQKVRRFFEEPPKPVRNSLQTEQPRDRKVTVWDPRDNCYYTPGNEMTIPRESFPTSQQPRPTRRQSEDDISKMILMYQMSTYVEDDEFSIHQHQHQQQQYQHQYQCPTARR